MERLEQIATNEHKTEKELELMENIQTLCNVAEELSEGEELEHREYS